MVDINAKIMEAMKSKNKAASETYKMLKAKILEFKTAKNAREYTDSEEINLIKKMIEERNNTAQIYKENNRPELAESELEQASILEGLLPALPTKEDIENYLNEKYPDGIDKKSMGLVIKEVKDALIGADGKTVSDSVRLRLL
jgi:hypothetical protein